MSSPVTHIPTLPDVTNYEIENITVARIHAAECEKWWIIQLSELQRKVIAQFHHFQRPLSPGEISWAYRHKYLTNKLPDSSVQTSGE